MSRRRMLATVSALVLAGAAAGLVPLGSPLAAGSQGASPSGLTVLSPCTGGGARHYRCLVKVVRRLATGAAVAPSSSPIPKALSPTDIATAYGFAKSDIGTGAGKTVAIVDAFDDPDIASNLTTFSREYRLPACTTGNHCFTKVNQSGASKPLPRQNSGWDVEISLDVEWAHAMAPKAHILLVEANDATTTLFVAVRYAAAHAQYVSMSWGGTEFTGESALDPDFGAPTVSFFAAAGDTPGTVIYPSASPEVISVGGTTLTVTPSSGKWRSETAWDTAGGGCSVYEKATTAQAGYPSYDQAGATCDGMRAMPDVALDANPETGVSVYDSIPALGFGSGGWEMVGGTSVATPIWAAHSAAAGDHVDATFVYGGVSIPFYNVTTGTNTHPCEPGYNLCTGLGSWNATHGIVDALGNLSFASASQVLTAGKASNAISLELSATAPAGGVPVTLTTTSPKGGFSTSAGGPYDDTTTVTVPAGTRSATVYYEDTAAGTPTIGAASSRWEPASQVETVEAATLASIEVTPALSTLGEGSTVTFTAKGYDTYGNPVTAGFSPSWTSTLGTFTPTSGTSTTFTAGKTPGGGMVVATTGGVRGAATVTVDAKPVLAVSVTAGATVRSGKDYAVDLTVLATGKSGGVKAHIVLDVHSGSCAGPVVWSKTVNTTSTGRAIFRFVTAATGAYCAMATVTASGYSPAEGTAVFEVAVP
jgi:hypothetical protein